MTLTRLPRTHLSTSQEPKTRTTPDLAGMALGAREGEEVVEVEVVAPVAAAVLDHLAQESLERWMTFKAHAKDHAAEE